MWARVRCECRLAAYHTPLVCTRCGLDAFTANVRAAARGSHVMIRMSSTAKGYAHAVPQLSTVGPFILVHKFQGVVVHLKSC